MTELIYPKEKHFEANGKKYRIDASLSYDRWIELQSCQLELAFAVSFKQLMENNDKIIQALNKVDFVSASVLAYNIKNGLKKIDEKQIPIAMKIAMLFINREDEDVRYFNEAILEEKINDMRLAGIDTNFFFQVAAHSVPHFMAAFKENIQDTSKVKKEKQNQ